MVVNMADSRVMIVPVDGAGRMVIPRRLRERLGLRGPGEVEISEREDRLEVRAAPSPMHLERSAQGVAVLRPESELPPMTAEMVRSELDRTRQQR